MVLARLRDMNTTRIQFLVWSCLVGALGPGCAKSVLPQISEITPTPICDAAPDRTFTVKGSGFLRAELPPMVTFARTDNPAQLATAMAMNLAGCEDDNCTSFTVAFSAAQLPVGRYSVSIVNGCEDNCKSTQMGPPAQVEVVSPPVLTQVAPQVICSGSGRLTLTGSKFASSATVTLGTAAAMSMSIAADGASATANFTGPLPVSPVDAMTQKPTPFDVKIANAAGCEATLAQAVVVTPGPALLFADPPTVPAGYAIQATVYAASVGGLVSKVGIAPTGTSNFTDLATTTDPQRPNRVLVNLPGNLAAGSYDLRLQDQTDCPAMLTAAIKVVASPTLTVSAVSPGFGAPMQPTALQVDGTGFANVPRLYVAVNGGGTGVTAAPLRAVSFTSATQLGAVIPSDLGPGTYDLIVVNPDGSFGVRNGAFVVTQPTAPPPTVSSISPSSLIEATASPIRILGSGFRASQVGANCFNAVGTMMPGTVVVGATTATSIAATVNAPTGFLYCILRVRNPDNMTFVDYSAVGITNNSLNLRGFSAGANLLTARRALVTVAGRPTQTARFVYAIGGDNTDPTMPLRSVEAAGTNLAGNLSMFRTLTQQLPKGLSFAGGAVAGRFIYHVGGFDGTAAVRDVYRAEILDPLNVPTVSDVDVRLDAVSGLAPGLYSYRVAAVMGATDANNPGGETLASDVFPVQIPSVSMGKIQVILFWKQVPGAASYRVYRTPMVNQASGAEALLGSVTDSGQSLQSFNDNGTATVNTSQVPLALGSTGAWRALAQLNTARMGAGVAIVPDPVTAGVAYLYAQGGNSANLNAPTLLSSVEFMTLTDQAGGAMQNTSGWTVATNGLPVAKWLIPGLAGTNTQNSVIPAGQGYLYAGSGLSSTIAVSTLSRPVHVASIAAGGQPGVYASTGSVGVNLAGFGTALVNNQMYAFGGLMAGAGQTAATSATLTMPMTVSNFNALGSGTLTVARGLQGTAIESAFIYQIGGTSGAAALTSCEQTIW